MPLENPRIVIKKKLRRLEIFDGEKLIKTYRISLGFCAAGGKRIEGDGKTPIGEFYVCVKNDQSKFYLSLGLNYPNLAAAKRGLRERIVSEEEFAAIVEAIAEKRMPPQKTALGGEIYIHGGGIEADWTRGCIAVRDEEMREIFDAIEVGAKVSISEK